MRTSTLLALLAVCTLPVAAGCGSSSGPSSSSSSAPAPPTGSTATTGGQGTSTSGNVLIPESQAVAAGDIPDNQVFLTFHNAADGYSMKYPEGWAQQGSGSMVTFRDKNNVIRVSVGNGPATVAQAAAEMSRLAASTPKLTSTRPVARPSCTRNGARVRLPNVAVGLRYSVTSAPDPVTGKRVLLNVDRYELAAGNRRAVVDLGTPQGVDNVDAYCLIISSFTWR